MAAPDYSTVKTLLGITGSSEDTRLTALTAAAWAEVVRYCGRDFLETSYPGAAAEGSGDSGLYCGNGTVSLYLRQRPVTAVASIYLDPTGYFAENPDGAFTSAALLVDGVDYAVAWDGCLAGTSTKCSRSGRIDRIGGTWPGRAMYRRGTLTPSPLPAIGNIKVTYTAGYATLPADLVMATAELVGWLRRNSAAGGVATQSEGWEDYSYSLASGALSGSAPEIGTVRQLLSRWKERVI